MSALKELINSLVDVINRYYDIKSGIRTIDAPRPIDALLEKNPDDLKSTLTNLICEAGKITPTRVNFLTYLTGIIETVNPMIDHQEPLNDSESLLVTKILTDLIYHTQQLSLLSHNTLYRFEFNGIKISAYGFETGYLKNTPCTTGDLMRRVFPVPGITLTPDQFPLAKIEQFVKTMIVDHQNSCHLLLLKQHVELLQQENTSLKQENERLREKNNTQTKNIGQQTSQDSTVQRQVTHLQQTSLPTPPPEPAIIPRQFSFSRASEMGLGFVSQFFQPTASSAATTDSPRLFTNARFFMEGDSLGDEPSSFSLQPAYSPSDAPKSPLA